MIMPRRCPPLAVALAALMAILSPAVASGQQAEDRPLRYDGATILDVSIQAPAPLRDAARRALALRVGDPYRIDATRRTMQNIYALGDVSDVQVEARERDEGIELLVRVLPAPRIRRIRLRGESPVGKGPLEQTLRIRAGDRIDGRVAEAQAERVQLALSDRGYLGARVEPEIELSATGLAADVTFHIEAGAPTRLRRLQIVGEPELSPESIRAELDLVEGGVYRALELDDGIRAVRDRLAREGYFHGSVEIVDQAVNPFANTVDLTLEIEAGPRVELAIQGWDRDADEQRESLPIWRERSVADWVLKSTRMAIIDDLQRRGHWRPLVIYNRRRDDAGRNVSVTFNVNPGLEAKVAEVRFEGNETLTDEALKGVVGTEESRLFRPRYLRSQRWERDREVVRAHYRRQGFVDARVTDASVRLDRAAGGLIATMTIDEGERIRIGEIDLTFIPDAPPRSVTERSWLDGLALRSGVPYDPSALREDEGRLRIDLANAGYPRGVVLSEVQIDREESLARIRYDVYPGERVRVDRVLVAGNSQTHDEVILREMALLAGSPYSYEGIVRSQSRLYRLGLFSRVEVAPAQPDAVANERTVVVRVEEGPASRLSWGIGYDTEEGPRGLVTIANDNLWGMNRSVTLSLRSSFREQRGRFVLTEPYLFGRSLRASTIAFMESIKEEAFDVERLGATFQVTERHNDDLTSFARYTFRRVRTFDLQVDPAELDPEDRSSVIGSVIYSLIRDTRPDPIDPRSGSYHTLDAEISTELLGSEADFFKVFGRSQWYWPLGPTVVAASARVGIALPFAGDNDLPLPERFFTGGPSSLRAFELNTAGPTDESGNALGGEALFLGNVELRFPIRDSLGGVLFADAGNVFAELDTVSLDGIREIAGIGLRYATPVGPLRLDWGRLLDRREAEDSSRLFISIGHTF